MNSAAQTKNTAIKTTDKYQLMIKMVKKDKPHP